MCVKQSQRTTKCNIQLWCCCCCVGVLRPFDTFKGHFERAQLTYQHHSWASLLGSLPVLSAHSFASTDNCPSWISGRETMAEEFFSWPKSQRKNVRRTWGSNPRPSAYQADAHPIEPPRMATCDVTVKTRVLFWSRSGRWCWTTFSDKVQ